jgi:hypothetical protein
MHEQRTSMAFRERVMVVQWYSVGSDFASEAFGMSGISFPLFFH